MDFRQIFTPGAPPQSRDLLVGRDQEIRSLISYLKSPGVHPVVVGPRGVGKTSLVQEVISEFELSYQIEANTVKDFNELSRHICDDSNVVQQLVTQTVDSHDQTMNAKATALMSLPRETVGLITERLCQQGSSLATTLFQ